LPNVSAKPNVLKLGTATNNWLAFVTCNSD
jgi:hypothetical protein